MKIRTDSLCIVIRCWWGEPHDGERPRMAFDVINHLFADRNHHSGALGSAGGGML